MVTLLLDVPKGVDNLTINEENRLRIKLDDLTKKNDEIGTMELRHREEIGTIKQQMNELMMMVQINPRLANIKPEILLIKQSQHHCSSIS